VAVTRHWQGDWGEIVVKFDSEGTAIAAGFFDCYRVDPGPLGNLLWRIKRQWHRWFP
jgi:hypothetical protein